MGQKVARITFSLGFVVYLKDIYICTLLSKRFPSKKLPCVKLRKRAICKMYCSKKIPNLTIAKYWNHQKEHRKLHLRHLNSFSISQFFSISLHFYCAILIHVLKQKNKKLFEGIENLFMCLICIFLNDASHFC